MFRVKGINVFMFFLSPGRRVGSVKNVYVYLLSCAEASTGVTYLETFATHPERVVTYVTNNQGLVNKPLHHRITGGVGRVSVVSGLGARWGTLPG